MFFFFFAFVNTVIEKFDRMVIFQQRLYNKPKVLHFADITDSYNTNKRVTNIEMITKG